MRLLAVLKSLFFFYKKILHAPKAPKAPKAQRGNHTNNSTSIHMNKN